MLNLVILASAAFAQPAVSDGELAQMRGGMDLPNGLTVNIGVDIQTMVDGQLALQTIYQSDGPNTGLQIKSGDSGEAKIVTNGQGATASYASPGLTVQQMIGDRIGAVVSNSSDNRLISTVATISISLGGIPVQQMTNGLALQHLATDVARH